jgi:hypothetical protein
LAAWLPLISRKESFRREGSGTTSIEESGSSGAASGEMRRFRG